MPLNTGMVQPVFFFLNQTTREMRLNKIKAVPETIDNADFDVLKEASFAFFFF